MKKTIASLLISSILVTAFASSADAAMKYRQRDRYKPHQSHGSTTIDLTTGLRLNDFDWNIASDITGTATPNILSELTWEDITVFEIKGKFRHIEPANFAILKGGIQLDAELTGGFTISGDNQDSDYLGDDRTLEFSRSNNDAGGGFAFGGEVAAGYRFNVAQKVRPASSTYFTLAPMLGYGWNRQKYKMTDGNQTIPDLGSFDGLDSSYTADWYGPFVGLEAQLEHNRHLFTLRGEKHSLTYDAEAVWNLRTDFEQDPSYTHEADDGDGTEITLGYNYAVDSKYDLSLDYMYTERSAEDGIDTTFFTNGTVTSIRLNEVNDTSHAIRAGFKYYFTPPTKSSITSKESVSGRPAASGPQRANDR
jgi:hypothetical protein